jgi:hypothetical protein
VPISGKPLAPDASDDETAKFIGGQVALGQPMPPLGMGKEAAAMRRAILAEATKQWKAMGISPGEANVIAAENKSGLAELAKIAQMKATKFRPPRTPLRQRQSGAVAARFGGLDRFPDLQRVAAGWPPRDRRFQGFGVRCRGENASDRICPRHVGRQQQQLSDSARHEADALIHTSMTPDQFRAAIKQMKIDMANRTKGIEQERQARFSRSGPAGRASSSF